MESEIRYLPKICPNFKKIHETGCGVGWAIVVGTGQGIGIVGTGRSCQFPRCGLASQPPLNFSSASAAAPEAGGSCKWSHHHVGGEGGRGAVHAGPPPHGEGRWQRDERDERGRDGGWRWGGSGGLPGSTGRVCCWTWESAQAAPDWSPASSASLWPRPGELTRVRGRSAWTHLAALNLSAKCSAVQCRWLRAKRRGAATCHRLPLNTAHCPVHYHTGNNKIKCNYCKKAFS